jgi:predicted RNA-binding protein YlqC (UPF0109 family)
MTDRSGTLSQRRWRCTCKFGWWQNPSTRIESDRPSEAAGELSLPYFNRLIWLMVEALDKLHKTIIQMVRGLVDTPDAVAVLMKADDQRVSFMISAAPGEIGQVIDKQGRTARAIRTIAMATGFRFGGIVSVDIDAGGNKVRPD